MKFGMNLITRGRPEILRRSILRTAENIVLPDTVFMVSADEDDGPTCDMLTKEFCNDRRVTVSIAPREDTLAEKYDRLLTHDVDVISNLSDYTSYRTPGFDKIIMDRMALFPEGLGMVVNPKRNASFSDLYAVSKPMCAMLGYYFPPFFSYWFIDHWLEDIGRYTGRIAMADVSIVYDEQRGKPVTQNIREAVWWATFYDAGYIVRHAQANAIIAALDEPDWHKDLLRSRFALTDYVSAWINDNVRATASQLELASRAGRPDARYMRVKDKALGLAKEWIAEMPKDRGDYYRAILCAPPVQNLQRAYAR